MRTLLRNRQTIYYALVTDTTEIKDEYGNSTGSYQITYGSPVELKINVSEERGTVEATQTGLITTYRRTLVTTKDLPIKDNTIFWVDIVPDSDGESGTIKHNYIVEVISKSLNSLTITLKKVW